MVAQVFAHQHDHLRSPGVTPAPPTSRQPTPTLDHITHPGAPTMTASTPPSSKLPAPSSPPACSMNSNQRCVQEFQRQSLVRLVQLGQKVLPRKPLRRLRRPPSSPNPLPPVAAQRQPRLAHLAGPPRRAAQRSASSTTPTWSRCGKNVLALPAVPPASPAAPFLRYQSQSTSQTVPEFRPPSRPSSSLNFPAASARRAPATSSPPSASRHATPTRHCS